MDSKSETGIVYSSKFTLRKREKTFGCNQIVFVVSVVWPLSMIAMGIIYRNDCPFHIFYRPVNLPFALIVFGAFALYTFPKFLIFSKNMGKENDESLSNSDSTSTIEKQSYKEAFIAYFIFVIGVTSIVTASVLVYTIAVHIPNSTYIAPMYINSDPNLNCNGTFFWYSFWTFTTIFIGIPVLGLPILIYLLVSEIIFDCGQSKKIAQKESALI